MAVIKRPKCIVAGCGRPQSYIKKNLDGTLKLRNFCSKHHKVRTKLKGIKENYCENEDGHLGFGPCIATIVDSCQLHVDHVDGNRYNDSPANLRTYCANCHAVKTKRCGDHKNTYVDLPQSTLDNPDLFQSTESDTTTINQLFQFN
jgi:hypothetical protein